MTREISKDANLLLKYLENFKLKDQTSNSDYIRQLKSMHKKTYGFLLFVAELELQNSKQELIKASTLECIKETGSDIIQSIFCWSTGSYKPANMMLRSSIETFLKAILGNENESIYNEKSVYKIFEIARNNDQFTTEIGINIFENVHSSYKELCLIAHSARNVKLGTVGSIELLPRYDSDLASNYANMFIRLLESFLRFFLLNFNGIVSSMHSLNRTIFLSSITLTSKKEVYEYIYIKEGADITG